MKTKNRPLGLTIGTLAFMLSGCGTATSATTTLTEAIAAIAVTSPTASRATTASNFEYHSQGFFADLGHKIKGLILPESIAASTVDTDVKSMATLVSDLKTDLASSTPKAIAAKIGEMTVTSYRANCYGPSWTDTATGVSVARPSGDLGMIAANASTTDTTACAAAELNSLVGGAPQFANKLVKLQATLIAALQTAGKALPSVGASVDALALMPAITGFTFVTASLARLTNNAAGKPVYKTAITYTDASSKAGTVTIYHTPTNDANSNFSGLIQAVLPYTATGGGAGTKRGLSMVYSQTDGILTYALDTAANRTTDSSDFFSATTGRVDFSKGAFGEDGNRIIASFDSTTLASTMHYAWQAGSGDGAVRAFAVNIPAGTEGSLTGVGYFGFGAAISALTDDVSTPWATKMICNWVGVSKASIAEIQGQTFTQSGGKFTAATSKIDFAPTDTCAAASTYVITSSQPTDYNNAARSGTKLLTTVGALGIIPAVTVPTYTLPTT